MSFERLCRNAVFTLNVENSLVFLLGTGMPTVSMMD